MDSILYNLSRPKSPNVSSVRNTKLKRVRRPGNSQSVGETEILQGGREIHTLFQRLRNSLSWRILSAVCKTDLLIFPSLVAKIILTICLSPKGPTATSSVYYTCIWDAIHTSFSLSQTLFSLSVRLSLLGNCSMPNSSLELHLSL